ncbi:MAG: CocE/NonD family hydrolase [Myxococcota bacterium]
MSRTSVLLLALAAIMLVGAAAAPPGSEPLIKAELKNDADIANAIREHYTKHEYRIRMRDGVILHTDAFIPKDASRSYPILLQRTPYSLQPYGVDNLPSPKDARLLRRFAPSEHFIREGYIFVHQDVRGRLMSEGEFMDVRPRATKKGEVDEATDAYDTVDWLVRNVPNNNGRVGVWGISYPGFYAAQAAIDAHPAVKAISPQAPVTEWFIGDDFHHNGAFSLAPAFDFYGSFGKARPKPTKKMAWDNNHDMADVYEFFLGLGPVANANTRFFKGEIAFWNQLMEHGTRDDFWKARDPRPHYRDAKPAILTVGGWYDAEDLWGSLETYRAFETQSPRAENHLVMGPWRHGGWSRTDGDRLGDITFDAKTSLFYRERIELPFFERHLKGKSTEPTPEAWMFETGTNQWRQYPRWPPVEAKPVTLYFQAKGALSTTAPTTPQIDAGSDAYVSDPARPVPYDSRLSAEVEGEFMTGDQRFASRRPDVLVYSTGTLEEDVTLSGPLEASLWVTVTGTDADFVVKVIDVHPQDRADPDPNPTGVRLGGYQQLVRGEIMRGKFRNSFEKPEPFKPGEPTLVRIALPDVNHTFRAGHRIMVQVQSSWFPFMDRNPQTFTDIYRATESDFRAATHRVLRTKDMASGVKVLVSRGRVVEMVTR